MVKCLPIMQDTLGSIPTKGKGRERAMVWRIIRRETQFRSVAVEMRRGQMGQMEKTVMDELLHKDQNL